MSAGEKVGEAYVEIGVSAAAGEAELDRLMAKADRDFSELGRKRAVAELSIKSADFDAKIDDAKKQLDYLKGRKATATLDLAKKHFDEEIEAAKAQLKKLSSEKATVTVDTKQVTAANKAMKLLSDARALDEKHALAQSKAEDKLSKARATGYSDMLRQRVELGKLGDEYERLKGKQTELEKSSRGIFSSGSVAAVEKERTKIGRVGDELALTKHKIEELGGSVEGLDARMGKSSSTLDKLASKLGDTSVRIGPLTTSIKGLATGLGLLGPLIFELGGGAADLIGFLGSGIAGAAAVGGAGLAGFATSALGVGLIIKPMIKEFGEVKASSEALGKAQLKYGKDSKQAKTAQEQLDHELKGVSPIAKEAFKNYGRLGSEWQKLTAAARPAVFTAFGESLKTVQSLLPEFASESVKTTQVAGKAWDSWMKSLRSNGARKALGEIMSNFRASIPGIASGLGDIGATLGHIAAAASHFLPGLSHGFAEWAANLEKSVGSGNGLVQTIGGMVKNMRDFGHLAEASGSFLVHFFGDAASSGDKLNNSLTGVIKSWDRGIQTPKGKESLVNYFEESATATKDFFSVLGGAAKLLFEFSQATAPIANGLLHIVTFIGQLINAADQLVGVKTILQGVGYALAGLYIAGKIDKTISAIATLGSRIAAFIGLTSASTTETDANTAALEANTAALADNAAAAGDAGAARGLEGVATGGDDAALALGGAGEEAGGLAAALGGAAVAAAPFIIGGAVLAGIVYLGTQTGKVQSHWEALGGVFGEAANESTKGLQRIEKSTNTLAKSYTTEAKTAKNAETARKNLNTLYKEHAPASKITAAVEKLNSAEAAQAKNTKASASARLQSVQSAKQQLHSEEALVSAAKARAEQVQKERAGGVSTRGGGRSGAQIDHEEAVASQELAQALHRQSEARRELEVAQISNQRRQKELTPLSEQTVKGLNNLSKTIGGAAAQKIGNFVKPGQIAEITKLGNKLSSLGRGQQVKTISVKSSGADQTEAKLKRLQKQTNSVENARATVKVGANDIEAQSKLKRVSNLSQQVAGTKTTVNILANSANAEQAIQRLSANLRRIAQEKYQARLTAIDNATAPGSKARRSLEEVARGHYQARLTAIDNATAPAKKAAAAAKSVNGNYVAHISAPGAAQAAQQVQSVVSAISQLESKSVNITTNYKTTGTPPGGRATGGPMFAGGGADTLLAAQQARAAERAGTAPGGVPRHVTKPTYLVGEQAPSHPEYVLAMNPAYRGQNERYLEDAAGHLGKEVIPAYGKGGKHSGSGGGNNGGGKNSGSSKGSGNGNSAPSQDALYAEALKNAPKKSAGKHHFFLHKEAFNPQGVHKINEEEANLQTQESEYSNLLASEEQRLKHKEPPTHWEFGSLKNLKHKAYETNQTIINKLIPDVINFTRGEEEKAEKAYKELGPEVEAAREVTQNTKKEYTKASSKSTSKMTAKEKTANSKDVAAKKAAYTEAKAYEKKKKEERKHAKKIEQEAKEELNEIKHTRENTRIANKELGLEESELDFYQNNEKETPYYEEPETPEPVERGHPNTEPAELALVEAENRGLKGAELTPYKQAVKAAAEAEFAYAKTTPGIADDLEAANEVRSAASALEEANSPGGGAAPTLGEQTATASAARQQLYEQFASNVTSAASAAITSAAVPPAAHFSAQAAAVTPAYLPGGPGASMFDTASSLGGGPSTSAAGAGIVHYVTNNFAVPPPDPHTFSKNLQFELNA